MATKGLVDKPRAICIPAPLQSHIKTMFKVAKLLHHKGCHITLVNTEFNHNRLLKSRGSNSLNGLPDFQFETIPDGLPRSHDDTQNIPALWKAINNKFLAPFNDLLAKLNNATSSFNLPPVNCIISDGFMHYHRCPRLRNSCCISLYYLCLWLHGLKTISCTQRKRSYTTKREELPFYFVYLKV